MNILFLRAGIFSNLNDYLYQTMCRWHNVVQNVDAGRVIRRKSFRPSSWYNVLHTLIHSKKYWRQTHSKNTFAFTQMTKHCNRFVRWRTDYDIIFQTQCKFSITENPYSRPYYIYTDLTQKLTDRIWHRWALKGSTREVTAWYRMESDAYHRAQQIFTFNSEVSTSFIEDYHIDPAKVIVVGSGINGNHVSTIDLNKKYETGFNLFFLTTEFERQGGWTVVEAFELIKRSNKDINLIIGGKCPKNLPRDIGIYNLMTEAMIQKMFDNTLIFLMPGQLGGRQTVLQAMGKKCVCIVCSHNYLLTDVIIDKQTGFKIPLNDPIKLSEIVLELYHHESLLQTIAEQAYQYVTENFTWDKIVEKMTSYFEA